jgi:predicted small integral membrane protein
MRGPRHANRQQTGAKRFLSQNERSAPRCAALLRIEICEERPFFRNSVDVRSAPPIHTAFYIGIIAWESITMVLCWWAGVRLLKSYRADREQFVAAQNITIIALTTSLLMWLVAFLDVGGEWFLMWQSQIWNGQEAAFRMFTIVGVVFLVVVQRESTPE